MPSTKNSQQNQKSAYENCQFYRITDKVRRKYSGQISNRPAHQSASNRKYHNGRKDMFLLHSYRPLSLVNCDTKTSASVL